MGSAAWCSHFSFCLSIWRTTALRADVVPRWMLAVSHPIARSSRSSMSGARKEASSIREKSGARRGAVDYGLVKDISGPFVVLRPPCRRLDERFGFPGDVSAMPVGNGDI